MLDTRIRYWTRGERFLNFGDFLSEFISSEALIAPIVKADIYRLIGSAIHGPLIEQDLKHLSGDGKKANIVYWGCGMRNSSPIPEQLKESCEFFGVRGPLTREALGLPTTMPIGDPGLLLPIIYKPNVSKMEGKTICIPHFSERNDSKIIEISGADELVSPAVQDRGELQLLLDSIASADFVLCGSLHAAIVACAYDRPFAFWDTGFIDIPFKWADFAASLGIEAQFVSNVQEGLEFYRGVRERIQKPKLSQIIGCCPFAVRPSILVKALFYDDGMGEASERFIQSAGSLWLDQKENTEQLALSAHSGLLDEMQAEMSAVRVGRSMATKEMDWFASELAHLSATIQKRKNIAALEIARTTPTISFGDIEIGSSMLEGAWTPPNEIGAWSLPPLASVRFPAGSGWEKANSILLEGYAFVPHIGATPSKRRFKIWVNSTLTFDSEVENATSIHNFWLSFSVGIDEVTRVSGTDLILSIASTEVGSNQQLGLEADDRLIGFALAKARFIFGE